MSLALGDRGPGLVVLADQDRPDRPGLVAPGGQAVAEHLDDGLVDGRVILAVQAGDDRLDVADRPQGVDGEPLDVLLGVVHRLDQVGEDRPAGAEVRGELGRHFLGVR